MKLLSVIGIGRKNHHRASQTSTQATHTFCLPFFSGIAILFAGPCIARKFTPELARLIVRISTFFRSRGRLHYQQCTQKKRLMSFFSGEFSSLHRLRFTKAPTIKCLFLSWWYSMHDVQIKMWLSLLICVYLCSGSVHGSSSCAALSFCFSSGPTSGRWLKMISTSSTCESFVLLRDCDTLWPKIKLFPDEVVNSWMQTYHIRVV